MSFLYSFWPGWVTFTGLPNAFRQWQWHWHCHYLVLLCPSVECEMWNEVAGWKLELGLDLVLLILSFWVLNSTTEPSYNVATVTTTRLYLVFVRVVKRCKVICDSDDEWVWCWVMCLVAWHGMAWRGEWTKRTTKRNEMKRREKLLRFVRSTTRTRPCSLPCFSLLGFGLSL